MIQHPNQALPPTPAAEDEIDLRQVAAALQRHWLLVAKMGGGALLLSAVYAFLQPRVWQGEFQIVLSTSESNSGSIASLPLLSTMAGSGNSIAKANIETEVRVLESPSVLKPVFDYVRASKQRAGQNVDGLRFSDWVDTVKVNLEQGTSVLNIAYTDTDKGLILPVVDRISKEYQDYSGRDRRLGLSNAVTYLKQSIATFTPKAEASMQRAQAYALSNGLGLSDGMPAASGDGTGGGGSVEASRQAAQAKLLLLNQQLVQARAAGSAVVFQAPQLGANADLYRQYQATESRLSDLRSRLRDNDEMVRNLQRQRQSLIATLNRQTIGLLQGERATAQAALIASSRPKEVVLKHRELVRLAVRDEKTLAELENQLQTIQLEQAKRSEPWELISNPTLLDRPVAPKKGLIMGMGLLVGLVAGCGAALLVDHRSGRVYSGKELQQLLPGPLLAQLDSLALGGELSLLARGTLAGSHHVALVPVGMPPQAPAVQRLLSQLQQELPHTELRCSADLVGASDCDHQLLITTLGAATRSQLANLRQQLNLQGRPITGWLLLHA